VADELGIDLRSHVSRLFTPDDRSEFDLFVVMDTEQRARLLREHGIPAERIVILGDLDPEPIATRTILDPVDRPIEFFRDIYARIARCTNDLALVLAGGSDR
jgi:protein-tyrosine-phosphatase